MVTNLWGRWFLLKIVTRDPETNSKFAPKNGWFGILVSSFFCWGFGRPIFKGELIVSGMGYVGMDFSPMLDVETTRGFEVPRGGQM